MAEHGTTRFLNVDLELVATNDLDPLLAAIAAKTITLRDSWRGKTRTVWLEVSALPSTLEQRLVRWAKLIEALPAKPRRLWNGCRDRCLNIGIQAGATPHAAAFTISEPLVARLARLGVRIELTVYASSGER